jgi:hypothetical protein
VARFGVRGPELQARMFEVDAPPDPALAAAFAERARSALTLGRAGTPRLDS